MKHLDQYAPEVRVEKISNLFARMEKEMSHQPSGAKITRKQIEAEKFDNGNGELSFFDVKEDIPLRSLEYR